MKVRELVQSQTVVDVYELECPHCLNMAYQQSFSIRLSPQFDVFILCMACGFIFTNEEFIENNFNFET